jgi:hypothetical protein
MKEDSDFRAQSAPTIAVSQSIPDDMRERFARALAFGESFSLEEMK